MLSMCAADPGVNLRGPVSYDRVERTEIAAVLSDISAGHGHNSLLVVVNEYGGSQLMRQSVCHVIEESDPQSYDSQDVGICSTNFSPPPFSIR